MGGPRHAYEDRWPSALEAALGGKVRVIAEGLGGRTTVHDDWYRRCRPQRRPRPADAASSSHEPLDMVIIMLGTNDLKPFQGWHGARGVAGVRAAGCRSCAAMPRSRTASAAQDRHRGAAASVEDQRPSRDDGCISARTTAIEQSQAVRDCYYKRRADELGTASSMPSTVARPDPD